MRFEKSQDPVNTLRGLAMAVALLREVSPDIRIAGGVADVMREIATPEPIALHLDWLASKLGRAVEPSEVESILTSLGFAVTPAASGILWVTVPSWRAAKDVTVRVFSSPFLFAITTPFNSTLALHRSIKTFCPKFADNYGLPAHTQSVCTQRKKHERKHTREPNFQALFALKTARSS